MRSSLESCNAFPMFFLFSLKIASKNSLSKILEGPSFQPPYHPYLELPINANAPFSVVTNSSPIESTEE